MPCKVEESGRLRWWPNPEFAWSKESPAQVRDAPDVSASSSPPNKKAEAALSTKLGLVPSALTTLLCSQLCILSPLPSLRVQSNHGALVSRSAKDGQSAYRLCQSRPHSSWPCTSAHRRACGNESAISVSEARAAQARHSLPVLTGTISSCRLLHLFLLVTEQISLSPVPLAQATLRLLFVLAAQPP